VPSHRRLLARGRSVCRRRERVCWGDLRGSQRLVGRWDWFGRRPLGRRASRTSLSATYCVGRTPSWTLCNMTLHERGQSCAPCALFFVSTGRSIRCARIFTGNRTCAGSRVAVICGSPVRRTGGGGPLRRPFRVGSVCPAVRNAADRVALAGLARGIVVIRSRPPKGGLVADPPEE
jgi:hypothetical protein